MLKRTNDTENIHHGIEHNPVTAILGPRQSGKTTLAQSLNATSFYDMENPLDLARLDNPRMELSDKKGLVVIDEIQLRPELFPVIRYLVDQQPELKFLILGSASRDLIRQSSESLAGRITYYHLFGFRLQDTGLQTWKELWLRGGFPRSWTADSLEVSDQWRRDFITTYLERDIPALHLPLHHNFSLESHAQPRSCFRVHYPISSQTKRIFPLTHRSKYGIIFRLDKEKIMNIEKDIQPISYVKTHATDILKSINETHKPLYVTQNGKAKAVIVDPESYENMKKAVSLMKFLSLRDNEFQKKEYVSQDEVFAGIEKKNDWK